MKNRALIIALMDGKSIQFKEAGVSSTWKDLFPKTSMAYRVEWLAGVNGQQYVGELRIKPDPVPDKVYDVYTYMNPRGTFLPTHSRINYQQGRWQGWVLHTHIRITESTDDNGVVTKKIEEVKQ